jgi:hypothetical protein
MHVIKTYVRRRNNSTHFNLGPNWGVGVASFTLRLPCTLEKKFSVHTEYQAGWTVELILLPWKREKSVASGGNRTTNSRTSSPNPTRYTEYYIGSSKMLMKEIF